MAGPIPACRTALLLVALTATAAAQTALKPPMRGLVSMGTTGFHHVDGGIPDNSIDDIAALPGIFSGVVINLSWAQLQPTPDRLDTGSIDQPLDAVRRYNAANPAHPLAVNLRVWPGSSTPDWLKSMGGPPIQIFMRGAPMTVGRFWDRNFRAYWRALQAKLAARYDRDPLVREVSDTSCSSVTDESFIVPADPNSMANLRAGGFSDAGYMDCLANTAQDYAAWRSTRVTWAFNPFRRTDEGRPRVDDQVTLTVMQGWRGQMGERGVLTNHALQSPPKPLLMEIYQQMQSLGAPIEFQTVSPQISRDLPPIAGLARSYGAEALEIWDRPKGFGFTTPQAMAQAAATLGGP